MWPLLLVGVALALGLRSRIAARTQGKVVTGVTLLVIAYVAVSKHLL
jgi:hypothetical protein